MRILPDDNKNGCIRETPLRVARKPRRRDGQRIRYEAVSQPFEAPRLLECVKPVTRFLTNLRDVTGNAPLEQPGCSEF
jgi:hypothetical protein